LLYVEEVETAEYSTDEVGLETGWVIEISLLDTTLVVTTDSVTVAFWLEGMIAFRGCDVLP
jgi:hypothetical protein